MQLKLKRSQTTTGLLSKSALFILDARADLSNEERECVRKYNLGKEIVYAGEDARRHVEAGRNSTSLVKSAVSLARAHLSLHITIDSLTKGQRIECKDLGEILDAEAALMSACENVKAFIATALTFDGREQVFEF